jgi:hypothetical protein
MVTDPFCANDQLALGDDPGTRPRAPRRGNTRPLTSDATATRQGSAQHARTVSLCPATGTTFVRADGSVGDTSRAAARVVMIASRRPPRESLTRYLEACCGISPGEWRPRQAITRRANLCEFAKVRSVRTTGMSWDLATKPPGVRADSDRLFQRARVWQLDFRGCRPDGLMLVYWLVGG